jgi:glucokinase
MVTLGTGIGGALLVAGRLHTGRNGMAGEFGHMRVVPDGRPCECGHTGCWEQYCSGKALARFARDAGSSAMGPTLTEAASYGEPAALGAFAEVGRWLGIGLADLVAAFDPDLVLVGGGVSAAGELLLEPARRAFAEALVGSGHRAEPRILAAGLGPLAGLVGAADLAARAEEQR